MSPTFLEQPKQVFQPMTVAMRVAGELRDLIENGRWGYGEKLPPVRELAQEFEVSPNSAQEAVRLLAEDDVLFLQPRQGSFVKWQNGVSDFENKITTEIGIVRSLTKQSNSENSEDWGETILHFLELELLKYGVHINMLSYPPDSDNPLGCVVKRIKQYKKQLGAVVCLPVLWEQNLLKELDGFSIPHVVINAPRRDSVSNFVSANNQEGARLVGRCFGEIGLKNIWYLTTSFGASTSSKEKLVGLFEGLVDSGQQTPKLSTLFCDNANEKNGFDVVYKKLEEVTNDSGKSLPDGIFASGDYLAIGAIRACKKFDLSIPDDVGVVGSTGTDSATFINPTLTVLAQPMEQIGKQAANMLLQIIKNKQSIQAGKRVVSPLIERQSFKIPKYVIEKLNKEHQQQIEKRCATK